MRIDKLHIKDYGQFHDKDVTLAPGINVVYGANEAGKSTVKDFIVDMLYGIDRSRGDITEVGRYEKRKPIGGSAYAGSMEINSENNAYLLEQNFLQTEQSTVLKNLETGQEVPLVDQNSVRGALIQTDKSTYLNTLCVGHTAVATDKAIRNRLNDYIVNMASAKAGDVDATAALAQLEEKKEQFSNAELEKREQEINSKLQLNRDFDAELAALKEEYKKIENSQDGQKLQFSPIKKEKTDQDKTGKDDENRQEQDKSESDQDTDLLRNMGKKSILDSPLIIIFIGVMIIGIFVAIAGLLPVTQQLKIGIIAAGTLFSLLTIIQVLVNRSKLYKKLEEIEIEQGFEEAKTESDDQDAKKELESRLADNQKKQEKVLVERGEQEQLLTEYEFIKKKMADNQKETMALDLAIKLIRDLSEEIYESFGSVLNERVSQLVDRITEHKYSDVKIDNQLRVMVRNGENYISMEYLSTGTIEQIYLALRLSIADVLIKEELPIIMDDIFITYDYQRIYETISCLSEYLNRQIILFTTNPVLKDMISGLDVENHFIEL